MVPVKLKHLSAHPAIDAQSSMDFCVLPPGALWWWWSQSGIAGEAEISIAVVAPAAKPIAAGSVATDRATRTATMVRPIRMNPLYPSEPQTTNLRIQSLCGSQLGVNALIFVKVAACAMRGKNRRLMMVLGCHLPQSSLKSFSLHTIFEADDEGRLPSPAPAFAPSVLRLGKSSARRLPRRSCEATEASGSPSGLRLASQCARWRA